MRSLNGCAAMNTLSSPGLVMTMHWQPLVLTLGYGPLAQFLCRVDRGGALPLDQHVAPPRLTGGEILLFKKCTQRQNTPPCIQRVHGLLA